MTAPLEEACRDGDARRVARLLAEGADPNEPLDSLGTTPLMIAPSVEVLDVLLGTGARTDATKFDHDVLDVVVADDETAIEDESARRAAARRLLEHGAPLERRNEYGWGRLYRAAFAADAGAVATLLTVGADADDDPPPLAAACWRSGEDADATERIIELLVAAGADTDRRDATGWHLLHAAAMPYSHGVGYESSDGPSPAAIRALVAAGVAADVAGPGGITALMLAAEDGAHDALETLLDVGADPHATDDDGRRAIDRARRSEQHLTELVAQCDRDTRAAVGGARDRAARCVELLAAVDPRRRRG